MNTFKFFQIKFRRRHNTKQIQHEKDENIQSEEWIEPLTETTVYPDTIWQERERNGECKQKERKKKQREKKEEKERREEKRRERIEKKK